MCLQIFLEGVLAPCAYGAKYLNNSIAFSRAPRREADSQPISQLARLAVSQTETHGLGFLSVADSAPSSGEERCPQGKQWPDGNAANRRLFGRRFETRSGEHDGAAADDSRPTRTRTANLKFYSRLRYHSTGVCGDSNMHPHYLEPSVHKLLTPPALKKVISSFRG